MSWDCKADTGIYLAGGRETFLARITDVPVPRYPSLEPAWPAALTVEAGRMTGDGFTPDPELRERLNLRHVVQWQDRRDDSLAQAAGEMSSVQRSYGIYYNFSMALPEAEVGQKIYLRTTYDTPETGRLSRTDAIEISAPCNSKARQRMQSSYVLEANFRGDHAEAVMLADSLVELGWRDGWGLSWAQPSAVHIGRPDKALRFLDLAFQATGRVEPAVDGGAASDSARQAELYQEHRRRLLKRIEDQQRER